MSPDTAPDTGMPGIRDFEASLPFVRDLSILGPRQRAEMRVCIPAGSPSHALRLAETIAAHISDANDPTDGPAWKAVLDDVYVEDVDGRPSPAELAAEVEHWRRVVTVLVSNLPLMTTVTAEQYAAADPAKLAVVPTPDGAMMFTTAPGLALAVTGQTDSPREPVDPDVVLPALPFQMSDPDVATISTHGLPSYARTTVDVLHDGEWMNLHDLTITADLAIKVQLDPVNGGTLREHTFTDLKAPLIVRPAAYPADGVDLVNAVGRDHRQVLTPDGWWKADDATFIDDAYRVVLSRANGDTVETHDRIYLPGDQVMLRQQPPAWWSK